jgi:D-glycero-alpha-D-manno-heptose-7-phosphate kinase
VTAPDASAPGLVASAPTRLDFGGGWTDVPPYPEERGGFVCNLAISRRATAHLRPMPGATTSEPLAAAALHRAGLRDVAVSLACDFPAGSGLGGSSAVGVALAAATAALTERTLPDPATLAERSRAVEAEDLGIAGGRQDHYAAAFGGALGLVFERDTRVEPIALDDATIAALGRRCLLLYTGESRISAATITAVLDAYRDRVPRVLAALDRMATLARGMRDALGTGDVDALAALVDEHWAHQRSLHPAITTARIDAIERSARAAGATGMKALGASGGGCVIVFAPPGDEERVAEAVAPHGERITWRVAREGVQVASG